MFRAARPLLILLPAALLLTDASGAAPRAGRGEVVFSAAGVDATPAAEDVSLAEAIARAQRRFPGRVVKAETTRRGDRREHIVRIINDAGRVRTFHIDAQTGEFR